MPAIIVNKGAGMGDFFPLAEGANVIGRSPSLAIHLYDLTVSRRHLRITCDTSAAAYLVEDLGSTHGVMVNGLRVREPVAIVDGDALTVGSMKFLFTARDIADRGEAFAVLDEQQADLATVNFAASAVRAMAASGEENARRRIERFRQWVGSDMATLAIVFTDVVASTVMTSELGNEAMERKRRAHFARVRSLVQVHDGYEIKSNGDGFMLAFRAAVKAVDGAIELCEDPGDRTLAVRVGVHIGPVVIRDEDVQGAAVSYAARVVDQAQGGGLWISSEVKNHLDQEKAQRHAGLVFQRRDGIELKGFPGTQSLWVVGGRTDEA